MKAASLQWSETSGWRGERPETAEAQIVFYFGSRATIAKAPCVSSLRALFPNARLLGCSTGGQIFAGDVTDDTAVALALKFDRTTIAATEHAIAQGGSSHAAGEAVGRDLARHDLKAVFVLSDGLCVNGSELVAGILSATGRQVVLTGGLAGDGADFGTTLVGGDEAPASGRVVAVGFYGDAITVGHGSAGGWDEFGPQRRVTKSAGNVLHELDGQPALSLYERYLGDDAKGLPSTALLYPLLVRNPDNPEHSVVRTVLSVDHERKTMTFAGDVPEGWSAQLMRGYFDRLADGAGDAASQAAACIPGDATDKAAILVSCIGRRILMGQNIIDEVAAAEEMLGPATQSVGFYSYGEIAPHAVSHLCELHNQTMTVTTFAEAA